MKTHHSLPSITREQDFREKDLSPVKVSSPFHSSVQTYQDPALAYCQLVPAQKYSVPDKQTWMGRYVHWLRQERAGWSKVGIIAFTTLEKLLLITSGIGLLFLKKQILESQRQQAKEAYFRKAKNTSPPSEDSLELKTSTRTFNHLQEFAINDGILWMRPRLRTNDHTWQPIYFDGFTEERFPVALDCDGANLIVLDEIHAVHYKKILKESRDKEEYHALDKGARDNWKESWFTLPYLHYLVNCLTTKRLILPQDARAWAISHRGCYNYYLEDRCQRKHFDKVGVTTLYVLDRHGKDIIKYDPWSPKHIHLSIPLPETSQTTFEAESIAVSASVIMAVGYEIHQDQPEKGLLKIYTRLSDINSEGWNPTLKYHYFDHPQQVEDVYIVPLPQWINHPLALEQDDFVTKKITILQRGTGNNARELRIEGQHQGKKGFFFKKVDQDRWQFKEIREIENARPVESPLPLEKKYPYAFQTTVHDYASTQVHLQYCDVDRVSARLFNFGARSFHSQLYLNLDQEEYVLDLHRKKTLKNFIGFQGDSYELTIPEELHTDSSIMKIFQGNKVIPIQVHQDLTHLILRGKGLTLYLKM